MKWYTAVGVKMENPDGAFCVQVGTQVKDLLGVECYIWNSLLWSFVEEKEIYIRMIRLLRLAFPEEPDKVNVDVEEFSFCFRRLLMRGLIAFREGETIEETARELFRTASVACVGRTFGERFLLFCESVAGGSPFTDSMHVFKKNPLEHTHRQLLKRIQGEGKEGFPLEDTEKELLEAVIELHQNKLLFIQSVKEGLLA